METSLFPFHQFLLPIIELFLSASGLNGNIFLSLTYNNF